jgi:hypothetical protein
MTPGGFRVSDDWWLSSRGLPLVADFRSGAEVAPLLSRSRETGIGFHWPEPGPERAAVC